MAEKFFWADQIADDIIKKNPKKNIYVCASGITPSGSVHIGNFREVITTDLVVRALKDKGKKVRFIYSWDDFDRFRKVPANVPKEWEKYIGMPLSDVMSPFGKGSYAEHFEKEFEDSLKEVGIEPEFIRQSEMNKKCEYAEEIKTALDNKDEIVKILNKYRKERLKEDWWPISVYCEKCRKDFTRILNVENYEIEYECDCGFSGKFDFRKKGIVKLVWRVDWPARWKHEGVDFEPGGIDHSTPGGSYTTAKEIVKKIYKGRVPLYEFYEWVRIKGGKEFSSSSGNVLTLKDVLEIYEPEVLRYLFVATRPNKGFQISFDNDVIKIYEDYDNLEERYYSGKIDEKDKRIYELSQIKLAKKKPERIGFRHLITLVQSSKKISGRGEKVKNWLEKYAGDDMKFEVKDKIGKLSKKEKDILIKVRDLLKKNLDEKNLQNELYEIGRDDVKGFFQLVYRILIGKKNGPRLAGLILANKEKVARLLKDL